MASRYVSQVKQNLSKSERILERFGVQQSARWRRNEFVTLQGITMLSMGTGQQLLSTQSEDDVGYRPDFGVLDDCQGPERLKSKDLRESDLEWFVEVFEPAFEPGSKIVVFANAYHYDSLAYRLSRLEGWKYIHLPLCDRNVKDASAVSYWEERHPIERLRLELRRAEELNKVDSFYRNRLADPLPPEGERAIREEDILVYNEEEWELSKRYGTFSFVVADVAKTNSMRSAHSAILGVTVDTMSRRIYIRRMMDGRWEPDQFLNYLFHVAAEIGAVVLCPEETGLEKWLRHQVLSKLASDRLAYEYSPVAAGGRSKDERFRQIVPYFVNKQIRVNADICFSIKGHLMRQGKAERRDVGDCFAYIPEVLMRYGLLFEAVPQEVEGGQSDSEKDDDFVQEWVQEERDLERFMEQDKLEGLKLPRHLFEPICRV
ncbi:MAG TPA: hypothetical protein VLH56_08470 [Dissulfurispiraceae bacterium]|nr:hypothetical protein [Dissulfurispiraceae bacterium]